MSNRTMLGAMLIGLVVMMFTPAALADTNMTDVAGHLTKIDGKTLTIDSNARQSTVVTCNGATRFSQSGGQAKFENLKVGEQVWAHYSKTDNTASEVTILKPATMSPPLLPAPACPPSPGSGRTLTAKRFPSLPPLALTGHNGVDRIAPAWPITLHRWPQPGPIAVRRKSGRSTPCR